MAGLASGLAGLASGLADWASVLADWASGLAGWPRGGDRWADVQTENFPILQAFVPYRSPKKRGKSSPEVFSIRSLSLQVWKWMSTLEVLSSTPSFKLEATFGSPEMLLASTTSNWVVAEWSITITLSSAVDSPAKI